MPDKKPYIAPNNSPNRIERNISRTYKFLYEHGVTKRSEEDFRKNLGSEKYRRKVHDALVDLNVSGVDKDYDKWMTNFTVMPGDVISSKGRNGRPMQSYYNSAFVIADEAKKKQLRDMNKLYDWGFTDPEGIEDVPTVKKAADAAAKTAQVQQPTTKQPAQQNTKTAQMPEQNVTQTPEQKVVKDVKPETTTAAPVETTTPVVQPTNTVEEPKKTVEQVSQVSTPIELPEQPAPLKPVQTTTVNKGKGVVEIGEPVIAPSEKYDIGWPQEQPSSQPADEAQYGSMFLGGEAKPLAEHGSAELRPTLENARKLNDFRQVLHDADIETIERSLERNKDKTDDRNQLANDIMLEELARKYGLGAAEDATGNLADVVNTVLGESGERWYDIMGRSIYPQGEIGKLARANQETDPSRLIPILQKAVEGQLEQLLSSQATNIDAQVERLGINRDAYIKEVIGPAVVNKACDMLYQELIKRAMPKSDAEYVIRSLGNSLIGTLGKMAVMSREQRQIESEASAIVESGQGGYNPGAMVRIAGGVVPLIVDAPAFSAGSSLANGAMRLTLGEARYAAGEAYNALRVANNPTFWNRLTIGFGRSMIRSGASFGFYDGVQDALTQLSLTGEWNAGETAKRAAGGFFTGAVIGVTGNAAHNLLGRYGINGMEEELSVKIAHGLQGVAAGGGRFATETAAFTLTNIAKDPDRFIDEDGKISGKMILTQLVDDATFLVGMKLGHGIMNIIKIPVDRGKSAMGNFMGVFMSHANNALKLDKEVWEELQGKTNDISDTLAKVYDFNKRPKDTGTGEEYLKNKTRIDAIRDAYKEATSDLSWDALNAMNMAVGGVAAKRPHADDWIYSDSDEEGGGGYISEVHYDESGKLVVLREYKYNDWEEAEAWKYRRENMQIQRDAIDAIGAARSRYSLSALTKMFDQYGDKSLLSQYLTESVPKEKWKDVVEAIRKDPSGEDAQAFMEYIDKNSPITRALLATAIIHGYDRIGDMMEVLYEDPELLDEVDREMLRTLRAEMLKISDTSEPDIALSRDKGAFEAETNGAGTENPNNEGIQQVNEEVSEAQRVFNEWLASNTEIAQEIARMQKEGKDLINIYMGLIRQGKTVEELAPFVDYINAVARQQGFMEQTGRNIDKAVNNRLHMARHSELGGVHVATLDDGSKVFIVGGKYDTDNGIGVRPHNVILVRGEDGKAVPSDGKNIRMVQVIDEETYAANYRAELEAKMNAAEPPVEEGGTTSPIAEGPETPTGDTPVEPPVSETPPVAEPPRSEEPPVVGGGTPPKSGETPVEPPKKPEGGEEPPAAGGKPPRTETPEWPEPPKGPRADTPPAEGPTPPKGEGPKQPSGPKSDKQKCDELWEQLLAKDDELSKELEEAANAFHNAINGKLNAGTDPRVLATFLNLTRALVKKGVVKFDMFALMCYQRFGENCKRYIRAGYEFIRREFEWSDDEEERRIAAEMDDTAGKERDYVDNLIKDIEQKAIRQNFVAYVRDELTAGRRPFSDITKIRAKAIEMGMDVKDDGSSDMMLRELIEEGISYAARDVISRGRESGKSNVEILEDLVAMYENQPTNTRRGGNTMLHQQYSTPVPMAFIADLFADKGSGKVLEPTAGNGLLVVGIDANRVDVNEIDADRLKVLENGGYNSVTNLDATRPFNRNGQYDSVVANPPFGTAAPVTRDGVTITKLEHQIALNALDGMKDDGRAAIIVGGNMKFTESGLIDGTADLDFYKYLYDHYNVCGVVDINGDLYRKQGTSYPIRMILIDGRRSEAERAEERVTPPTKDQSPRKAETFRDLYNIVEELKENKTNGNVHRQRRDNPDDVSGEETNNGPSGGERPSDGPVRPAGSVPGQGQGGGGQTVKGGPEAPAGTGQTGTGNGGGVLGADTGGAGGERGPSGNGAGPDRGDNGGGGVRGSDVGGGGGAVSGETGTNVAGVQGGEPVAPGVVKPQEEAPKRTLEDTHVKYDNIGKSSQGSLDSLVPANMAEGIRKSLDAVEAEHCGEGKYGTIDEWVAAEIGLDLEDITKNHKLSREQIDGIALAIHQIKKGKALIIGDQTGLGKGRQAAALILYGIKNGKKPIFLTQNTTLFSDMYRDLFALLKDENGNAAVPKPYIINANKGKNPGRITDDDKNVIFKAEGDVKQRRAFAEGRVPDGYDFVMVTYSQVNRTENNPKVGFLRNIARDNYLIMDESHTAGGESNTGTFFQEIIPDSKGVLFLSATYAKRPENMLLYVNKTALNEANMPSEVLLDVVKRGGRTLQEVMSETLTESGQMVRRERDMRDVETEWKTDTHEERNKVARERYDKTTDCFNACIDFQDKIAKHIIRRVNDLLAGQGSSADGGEGVNVDSSPLFSKTYNYSKQMLLCLKVPSVIEEVKQQIAAKRMPVIALENTLEGLLDGYAEGDALEYDSIAASLIKSLDSTLSFTSRERIDTNYLADNGIKAHFVETYRDSNGHTKYRYQVEVESLSPAGQARYNDIKNMIVKNAEGLPASPIDAIIEGLEAEGINVSEISGREMRTALDSEGIRRVVKREETNKKEAIRAFNNSPTVHVIILNKSGSTGISLHSSKDFDNQKQRAMIIAQPLSDINDYMQMLGRIDRTNQVYRGYYVNLALAVPCEKRFYMMLKGKLASLNANTTASQEGGKMDVQEIDLLNKYGSKVAIEYLKENPMVNNINIYDAMLHPFGEELSDEYTANENDINKFTGRLALLPCDVQEIVLNEVAERYQQYINELDEAGANDLRISQENLAAKTLSKRVFFPGNDPDSGNAFAGNTYIEEIEANVMRKPMSGREIQKQREDLLGGKGSHSEWTKEVVMPLLKNDQADFEKSAEARYNNKVEQLRNEFESKAESVRDDENLSDDEKENRIQQYQNELDGRLENEERRRDSSIETHRNMLTRVRDVVGMDGYGRQHLSPASGCFTIGQVYAMPNDLDVEQYTQAKAAVFLGYSVPKKKPTLNNVKAVFATLDNRRRITIRISDTEKFQRIVRCDHDNFNALVDEVYDKRTRQVDVDKWDKSKPTATRERLHVITGNVLSGMQQVMDADGRIPGRLTKFTDSEGNVRVGIVMRESWMPSTATGVTKPANELKEDVRTRLLHGADVVSQDGMIRIRASNGHYRLFIPKNGRNNRVFAGNEELVALTDEGHFFQPSGQLGQQYNCASIHTANFDRMMDVLGELGVRFKSYYMPESIDEVVDSLRDLYDDREYRIHVVEHTESFDTLAKIFGRARLKYGMRLPVEEIIRKYCGTTYLTADDLMDGIPFDEITDLTSLQEMCLAISDAANNQGITDRLNKYVDDFKRRIGVQVTEKLAQGKSTLQDVKNLFNIYVSQSKDADKLGYLGEKVFGLLEGLNVPVKYKVLSGNRIGESEGREVRYDYRKFNLVSDELKATVILHELIHTATSYAIRAVTDPDGFRRTTGATPHVSDEIRRAVNALNLIYKNIAADPYFNVHGNERMYGSTKLGEMVAEMANPYFRERLRTRGLWQAFKDCIKTLFGFTSDSEEAARIPEGTMEEAAAQALDQLLDNFDVNLWKQWTTAVSGPVSSKESFVDAKEIEGESGLAPEHRKKTAEEMASGSVPFNGKVIKEGERSKFRVIDDSKKSFRNFRGNGIGRYKDNVGKEMSGKVYVHKDYAAEVIPKELYDKALKAAEKAGFKFNSVCWDKKNLVRFDEAPDFDTAREPITGKWLKVDANTGEVVDNGTSNQIWHHKWAWVKDDYKGFDVEKAYNWSKEWSQKISNPDAWGYKWDYLLDQAGLPKDWNGSALSGKKDAYNDYERQTYSSEDTSLNQIPAGMKQVPWVRGTTNVDIGGGKYDKASNWLAERGVRNLVFDPFNRDAEHNRSVAEEVRSRKADTATCCNVLNVIDSSSARANVILQVAKAIRPDGVAYFTTWEGDRGGVGKKTTRGWQANRKTSDYLSEIRRYFGDVSKHGGLIVAKQPKTDGQKAIWDFDGRFAGNGIHFSTVGERNRYTVGPDAEKYFDHYIEEQDIKPVPHKPNKTVSKSLLGKLAKKYEGSSDYGTVLHHSEDGYGVFTNGQVLIYDKRLYDESHKEKNVVIKGKDKGKEVGFKYPEWKDILREKGAKIPVNFGHLLDFIGGCIVDTTVHKDGNPWTYYNWDPREDGVIFIRTSEGVIGYRTGYLEAFASVAESLGCDNILLAENGHLYASGENGGVAIVSVKPIMNFSKGFVKNKQYPYYFYRPEDGVPKSSEPVRTETPKPEQPVTGTETAGRKPIEEPVAEQPVETEKPATETPTVETEKPVEEPASEKVTAEPLEPFSEEELGEPAASEYVPMPPLKNAKARKKAEKRIKKLGVESSVEHIDGIEGVTDPGLRDYISRQHEQGKRVRGWFDDRTGRVCLYWPDIRSEYDAMTTIAHEIVGHKGLRGLLGEQGYRDFCRLLYDRITGDGRKEINDKMFRNGFNMYDAVDEYLAEAVEKTVPNGFWGSVGEILSDTYSRLNALLEGGAKSIVGEHAWRLNPDDLRYLFWASKHNLMMGNPKNGIIRSTFLRALGNDPIVALTAKDGLVYTSFGKGVYDSKEDALDDLRNGADLYMNYATDNGFMPSSVCTPEAKAMMAYYNNMVQRASTAVNEAFFDYAVSYKILQDAMASGIDMTDAMDAYKAENHMGSIIAQRQENFMRDQVKPLQDAVNKLLPAFGGRPKKAAEKMAGYILNKSGVERNRVLFVRDWADAKMEHDPVVEDATTNTVTFDFEGEPEPERDFDRACRSLADALDDGIITQAQYDAMVKAAARDAWVRWIEKEQASFNQKRAILRAEYEQGRITFREYADGVAEHIQRNIDAEYDPTNIEKDYSALQHEYTATRVTSSGGKSVTEKYIDEEALLDDLVEIEARIDGIQVGENRVLDFWNAVEDVAHFALKTEYDGGILSKETYEHVRDEMNWYVPMRDMGGDKAEDFYTYLDRYRPADRKSEVLTKRATGHEKRTVDPLARLMTMAANSIATAERNKVHQKMYNLVMASKGGQGKRSLVSVSRSWSVKEYDVHGKVVWNHTGPNITDDMDGDRMAAEIERFEQEMENLQSQGLAKQTRGRLRVPYGFGNESHAAQHAVNVFIGGRQYTMWVNGDPRAAQAINGALNPENNKVWMSIMRKMAGMQTTYNPTFVLRNTSRDFQFGMRNSFAKYGPKYVAKLMKHYAGGMTTAKMARYWKAYNDGTLDMSDDGQRYFKEWLDNGGRTGFADYYTIDRFKKMIDKSMKYNLQGNLGKAISMRTILGGVEYMNKLAENGMRYTAYRTSREMGKSILESIDDAKLVSVNFNRRGAGWKTAKGQNRTLAQKAAGATAGIGQTFWLYFNPTMQSLKQMYENTSNSKTAFRTVAAFAAMPILWGVLQPYINQLFAIAFGEDPDSPEANIANLPTYKRRKNLCIYAGKGRWITLPSSIEGSAFQGIGDILGAKLSGRDDLLDPQKSLTMELFGEMTQLLPVDWLGQGQSSVISFAPSLIQPIWQNMTNQKWTGAPIYDKGYKAKESKIDNTPKWTKSFKSTDYLWIWACRKLTDLTNGSESDDITAGKVNLNPGLLQNLFYGWTGGLGRDLVGGVSDMLEGTEYAKDTRSKTSGGVRTVGFNLSEAPLVKALYANPGTDSEEFRLRNQYYTARDAYDDKKRTIEAYEEGMKEGDANKAAHYNAYVYKYAEAMMEFEDIQKQIKQIDKYKKRATTAEEIRECDTQKRALMEQGAMLLNDLKGEVDLEKDKEKK